MLVTVGFSEPEKPVTNPTGDVLELLRENDKRGEKPCEQVALQPQWVGTVKVAFFRDSNKETDAEKPDPMRLNQIWRDPQGRVVIARAGKFGYTGSDAAVYHKELPALAELKTANTLAELRRWFGPQHGFADGWGGEGGLMHWGEGWTCFTTAKDGHLRWLNVFALVAGPHGAKDDQLKIESLTVKEGFFRVADPGSEAEKREFPSAEELEAAAETAREAERAKIPEPLRTLVAARQKQGDSDLRAYQDAINVIRRDPKPELFAQMAERIDDGTCEMQGTVEAILSDHGASHYGAPWDLKKKQLALHYAVAAIDHARTSSGLETWAELLLQALGGGHLQPKREDGELWIDLEVKMEGDSKSMSSGDSTITDENLAEAKRAIREEFRRKFPRLKP